MRSLAAYSALTVALMIASPCHLLAAPGDTSYMSIDLAQVTFGATAPAEGPQLLGGSPLILYCDNLTGSHYLRILTLGSRGEQLGARQDLALPQGAPPRAVIHSQYIKPGQVIVLHEDFSLSLIPLSFGGDGTPDPGAVSAVDPKDNGVMMGAATALTEIAGAGFSDGLNRLFAADDLGNIGVMLIDPMGDPNAIVWEGKLSTGSATPISAVEAIPQVGYIAIGAVQGGRIYGIKYTPPPYPPTPADEQKGFHFFSLADPRPSPIIDGFFLGDKDVPLEKAEPISLVIANGTEEIAVMSAPGAAEGNVVMNQVIGACIDIPGVGIGDIVGGSLLMLTTDGSGVVYDPYFNEQSGPSGCLVNVNNPNPDGCGCCDKAGDANNDTKVNIADVTFLIARIFAGGPAPPCCGEGSANGDNKVNIADATFLIARIFAGGPAPSCGPAGMGC